MTPRMLDALRKRFRATRQHAEYMNGQVAAAIVNSGFAAPETARTPLDFMRDPYKVPTPRRQTTAEMFAIFDRGVKIEVAAGRIVG
jgi:hypothetical protein